MLTLLHRRASTATYTPRPLSIRRRTGARQSIIHEDDTELPGSPRSPPDSTHYPLPTPAVHQLPRAHRFAGSRLASSRSISEAVPDISPIPVAGVASPPTSRQSRACVQGVPDSALSPFSPGSITSPPLSGGSMEREGRSESSTCEVDISATDGSVRHMSSDTLFRQSSGELCRVETKLMGDGSADGKPSSPPGAIHQTNLVTSTLLQSRTLSTSHTTNAARTGFSSGRGSTGSDGGSVGDTANSKSENGSGPVGPIHQHQHQHQHANGVFHVYFKEESQIHPVGSSDTAHAGTAISSRTGSTVSSDSSKEEKLPSNVSYV